MTDLGATLLFAVSAVFLVFELTAGAAMEHTSVELPRAAAYGQVRRNVGRRALLVEIPILALVICSVVLVLVIMLIHEESTVLVRLVTVAALAAIGAWCSFLVRRLSRLQDRV